MLLSLLYSESCPFLFFIDDCLRRNPEQIRKLDNQ
uniref:Uncharacterized protein n=1 Tax=Myoviridae sp. ctHP32 TaxID=2823539 RepID=A0A8S5LFZ3_9CAUD|nr:MAG TPA: hypothetical protein [Myoviridae sp. ctHP32]